MKARYALHKRDIIGRRIVDVVYRRYYDARAERVRADVCVIALDNGGYIWPFGYEIDSGVAATMLYSKPQKKRKIGG